jgi:hypothetical protein
LFAYSDAKSINGNHTYSILGADSIGVEIQDAVVEFLLYFHNRQFNLSWHASPTTSPFPRVRFTPVTATDDYFIARLLP